MARKHWTLSRQTEKRDEYEQWLNTAFSPWYSCMDIICFHIFSVLLCISLPSVVISRITEASEGCGRTECKKTDKQTKNMIQRENEAFLHLNIHQNESLVYFLIATWRRAHCICYYSCCCYFLSVWISVFQCRWTNIKHPKEISHPHFTPESPAI